MAKCLIGNNYGLTLQGSLGCECNNCEILLFLSGTAEKQSLLSQPSLDKKRIKNVLPNQKCCIESFQSITVYYIIGTLILLPLKEGIHLLVCQLWDHNQKG